MTLLVSSNLKTVASALSLTIDIIKIIELLISKEVKENAADKYISASYYESKRGRDLFDKVLARVPMAQ